ncbi:hypothetical protein [Aquimarina rubra]|uniref:Uncharacterized protein n=1 Tax=Aquimarina rubra TaxID=1920033 RepID=A0ABW5LLG8_9FLAO
MKNTFLILIFFITYSGFAQKTIRNKKKMCEMLTEMRNEDQLHRGTLSEYINNKEKYSQKAIDSVWALQLEIDVRNTKKLIELTKKYGWISDERIDCPKLNIWLIFRHAQEEYFEEISELIEKEYKAERLKTSHYRYIKNHLEGRPRMNN